MKNSQKFIFLLVILFILSFFSIFESFRIFPISALSLNFPFILHLLVLFLSIIILNVLFYFACIKNNKIKEFLRNFFTLIYSSIMLFYLLEGFFTFYPKSHSAGNIALSNISWTSYYNRPFNEYNFRGAPIGSLEGKKKIYAIGDSFTAGWGIRDFNQRYPEVLERKLGPGYRVINMGVPGFGTKDELYVLNQFINVYDFKKPDLIIWQYFFNDVLGIDPSSSEAVNPYPQQCAVSKYFFRNSFFLNFLYWSFPKEYSQDSVEYFMRNFFDNSKIKLHIKDIALFVNLCKEEKIPLIVIGFPYLNDLKRTCPIISLVGQILRSLDVRFINACDLLQDVPSKERIINHNDAHPSIYVHQLVAEELYRQIKD